MTARAPREADRKAAEEDLARRLDEKAAAEPPPKPRRVEGDDGSEGDLWDDVPV